MNDDIMSYGPAYQHQGGTQIDGTLRTSLSMASPGDVDYNYLSSYLFRESFTQSYATAITSEVDSTGFCSRHFDQDTYSLYIGGNVRRSSNRSRRMMRSLFKSCHRWNFQAETSRFWIHRSRFGYLLLRAPA